MDKKLIIANWKSHKNIEEAESFLLEISQNINKIDLDNKEIIIAPSFQLLYTCKKIIEKFNLPISIAAQNVSAFGEGAFTGEINASQVKDLADYVIVGHSERRDLLHEDEDTLNTKVKEANKANLKSVFCIQNGAQKIPSGAEIVAYEPPTAIGSGTPDSPTHIESVFEQVRQRFEGKILYGGSVNDENVRNFIHIKNCSGLLVGGASLDTKSFISLISQW